MHYFNDEEDDVMGNALADDEEEEEDEDDDLEDGDDMDDSDGEEETITFPPGDRVFAQETADTLSSMLTTVVDDALRGGKLKIPGYRVAAKTGTAFLTDGKGGYDKERYFHSLFGYFPAHDPKFIILLYTRDPKGVQYASETLAETYMSLVRELISYYEIPPDRQ